MEHNINTGVISTSPTSRKLKEHPKPNSKSDPDPNITPQDCSHNVAANNPVLMMRSRYDAQVVA